jgi:hypothetical protein
VILRVTDLERATRSCEHVLNVRGRRVSSGRHYFDCEGTILVCYSANADADDGESTPGEVAVRPWRERSSYVHDPFGNALWFVSRETVCTG